MDEYKGGTITLPSSCVESNFANIDDFPIVICVNMFKEKQGDATETADTADSTMMANALSIQPSAANAVSMQPLSSSDTTSLLCDFVGSSLKKSCYRWIQRCWKCYFRKAYLAGNQR